jgi:nucleotide-binding universal stress UspA family protein
MTSTIACCIDFSPLSDLVIDEASRLSKALASELLLIHAVRAEEPLTSGGMAPPGTHPLPTEDVDALKTRLTSEVERLVSRGLTVRGKLLIDEDPARAVLSEVASSGASHIVLGSHGHAMVFELLVGSFTQAVLRKSRVPVVVVPVSHSED